MRDQISFQRASQLHPIIRNEVIATITAIETAKFSPYMAIRIVQGLRTFPEQDSLYALGRTVKNTDGYNAIKKPMGNIVTLSKAGQSYHNYGTAFDYSLLYDKDKNGTFESLSWDLAVDFNADHIADWMEVVASFEALQYTWGGHFSKFPDNPHIEKHTLHWSELLKKYNAGDFIPGTKYVNL